LKGNDVALLLSRAQVELSRRGFAVQAAHIPLCLGRRVTWGDERRPSSDANLQQSGRGSIGVIPLAQLPVLDVSRLTTKQLDAVEKLFNAIATQQMLQAHRLDEDLVRHELDEKFGTEVLGLRSSLFADGGPIDLHRRKLAAEPSFRGNKAAEEAVA
jgi:hypothetical protein